MTTFAIVIAAIFGFLLGNIFVVEVRRPDYLWGFWVAAPLRLNHKSLVPTGSFLCKEKGFVGIDNHDGLGCHAF